MNMLPWESALLFALLVAFKLAPYLAGLVAVALATKGVRAVRGNAPLPGRVTVLSDQALGF